MVLDLLFFDFLFDAADEDDDVAELFTLDLDLLDSESILESRCWIKESKKRNLNLLLDEEELLL